MKPLIIQIIQNEIDYQNQLLDNKKSKRKKHETANNKFLPRLHKQLSNSFKNGGRLRTYYI